MELQEGFLKRAFREILVVDVPVPFRRLTYAEAMDRFGSDKPDLRFGLELKNISDLVANCSFQVFADPVKNGGSVRLINVPGGGESFARKQLDALGEFVKTVSRKRPGVAETWGGRDGLLLLRKIYDGSRAGRYHSAGAGQAGRPYPYRGRQQR